MRNYLYTIEENKFEKISEDQFNKDVQNCKYEDIKLPKRATVGSAGYDIYSPINFELKPGEEIKIPTGICVQLKHDCVLLIVPRSSLGFKYKLTLNNTIGVIDSDYYYSDNDGHIWIKMTNEGSKDLEILKGTAIAQGIIIKYETTCDDCADGVRNGGFGSTDSR